MYISNYVHEGIHFFMFPVSNLDDDGNVINASYSAEFLAEAYRQERWGHVKSERDGLLDASDWTQMPDSPLSDEVKLAWAEYRQALRDIPGLYDDPDAVVWPEKPA